MAEPVNGDKLKGFDASAMYQAEHYTDTFAGSLTRFTPVTIGGARDTERPIHWSSSVAMNHRGFQRTVLFTIPGAISLEDAVNGFPAAAMAAVQTEAAALEQQQVRSSLLSAAGRPLNS